MCEWGVGDVCVCVCVNDVCVMSVCVYICGVDVSVCVCVSDDVSLCMCSEYGRQVKFTFLDSLFGGQLVSTITCEECKHVSHCCRHFNVFVMYPDSTAHRHWPLQVVSLHSCSSARG